MNKLHFILSLSAFLALSACRKEVEVDVPEGESHYVVEGSIEQGRPPMVILTESQPYFAESEQEDYGKLFVHDADVTVKTGQQTFELQELCSSQLPDSLLGNFVEVAGMDEELLESVDFCVYSDPALIGQAGKSYSLEIEVDGEHITSRTHIPNPVELDSAWFELYQDRDEEGFVWGRIEDPDTLGNAYRWYAKRINKGSDGDPKDAAFIAPMGSVLDDRYFNGKEFEINYPRGRNPSDVEPGDDETIFYETGDTIAVKFTSISIPVYRFYRTFEEARFNTGNPFAAPTDVRSNVDNALGVWAGFGISRDTVVAKK